MASPDLNQAPGGRRRRTNQWLMSLLSRIARQLTKSLRGRQVPVVLQLNAVECGAACLAMILNYFGREVRVSECRQDLDIGRDGTTARDIATAARAQGLRVRSYSLGPAEFKYVTLPAIIHWNFNHFVVVERWSERQVRIVDPAAGRRRLTAEEFDAGFTGIVLMFEPGAQFESRTLKNHSLWRSYFFKHVLQSPGLLAQVIIASLFLQILGLALPILTKVMVDDVLPFRLHQVMSIVGLGVLILVLSQILSASLRGLMLIYMQARIDAQMMLSFFEHLLSLPFQFFQRRSSGDLLMRLSSNTVIREILTGQTISVVLDGTLVLFYLAALMLKSTLFGFIVLGLGALQVALLLVTNRRVQSLMQRDLSAQAESQSYLVEVLKGVETLKASGAEHRAFDHWSNLFFKQLNISLRRNRLTTYTEAAMGALRTLAPLLLLWVGTQRVLDGRMSLGLMLALVALATSFMVPLSSLVLNGQRLQMVGSHLERIADVLEAEPEQDVQAARHAPKLSGRIELKDVCFRYHQNAPLILREITMTIEPGRKIAIVGRTGSGKSTLLRLLLGLYLPTEGEILYDGQSLQSLNYRTLRSQFGVVLQEPTLFSGSIRQNIAFDEPTMSLERIHEAATLAAIHEEIMRLPMGYETVVAEGNSGLAGGQIQRLVLARALARQPVVLLLDEATSHLDVLTERRIEEHLIPLRCTRVVISHRLSTIRDADIIYVLDQGGIVERGTHAELVAHAGLYAELVRHQLETNDSAMGNPAPAPS